MSEERNLYRDIVAVLFLCAAAVLAISFVTYHPADPIPAEIGPVSLFYQHDPVTLPASDHAANALGEWGSLTANVFHSHFGLASYYILASLIGIAIWMFRQPYIGSPVLRTAGWFVSLLGVATFLSLLFPQISSGPVIGGGGYLGAIGSLLLQKQFALPGGVILATSVAIAGMVAFSDETFFRSLKWVAVSTVGGVVFARQVAPNLNPNRLRYRFDAGTGTAADGTGLAIAGTDLESTIDAGTSDSGSSDEQDSEQEAEEERAYTIRIQGRTETTAVEAEADADAESDLVDAYEDGALVEEEYEAAAEDEHEEEYGEEEEFEDEDADDEQVNSGILSGIVSKLKGGKSSASASEEPEAESATILPVSGKPHFKLSDKESVARETTAKESDKQENDPRKDVMVALDKASLAEQESDYVMPDIRLLQYGKGPSVEEQKLEVNRKAGILEKTFKEFGFDIKVRDIEAGPVISQYEIELEPGLRLSKITGLAEDIAIALRVPSVRVVAPIPGKCTVGIEVPNEQRQMVCLRDVMEEGRETTRKMKIPLFLGKDVSGNPLAADLAQLPHLLIAGRTGTGKSVCLNAIITSILMTRRPDEVRMLMIDPKMVELSGYARLPHLMHPVVTDMRKAEAILAWAVDKMEERYQLLARAGVRHLTSYNQLGEDELFERMQIADEDEKKLIPRSLPFIVIVADEMADLMMTAGKEVEQHIIRLAQKSRAVGIHLILATQKPTVDVITGLIKSNLPSRIAFQVASKTDSRVVLDENGADKLLGNGDMLFLGSGSSMLMRGQGTYLSDDEIDMITDTVSTNQQAFVPELVNLKLEEEDDSEEEPAALQNRDEYYERAVEVIVNEGRGSLSLLQRALGIGYGRAARLIDFMAEDGIVGEYNGSKSREVLMTSEQLERMKSGGSNAEYDNDDDDPEPTPPQPPQPPRRTRPSLNSGGLTGASSLAATSVSGSQVANAVSNLSELVDTIADDLDEIDEDDVDEIEDDEVDVDAESEQDYVDETEEDESDEDGAYDEAEYEEAEYEEAEEYEDDEYEYEEEVVAADDSAIGAADEKVTEEDGEEEDAGEEDAEDDHVEDDHVEDDHVEDEDVEDEDVDEDWDEDMDDEQSAEEAEDQSHSGPALYVSEEEEYEEGEYEDYDEDEDDIEYVESA